MMVRLSSASVVTVVEGSPPASGRASKRKTRTMATKTTRKPAPRAKAMTAAAATKKGPARKAAKPSRLDPATKITVLKADAVLRGGRAAIASQ